MILIEQKTNEPIFLHDYDSKFTADFDQILKSEGVRAQKVGPHAPNLNAYAERWVQAVQQECLDHFVFFGEEHFRHVVAEYVDYHNTQRPHQSKDNLPRTGPSEPMNGEGRVLCQQRLGGVLKHYYRSAA